ncbi:MAG: DEAD/DEAH box helicase family protein [Dysgonamonadaceae bacterium]|jgi:type I restriction enzyme R subunit|nr:DEAD/DEAH box helicase family protein [Dysgonamonadaceae bacterium]
MSEKTIHLNTLDSEADTCRKEVLPKLYNSGWTDDLILEQRTFTDGKIVITGRKAKRKKAKRFDYLLRYSQNFPIAIVEAKSKYKNASDGLQQAKEYAQMLQLKFAYATNGKNIIEFDFITGKEQKILNYPSPDELWNRLNIVEPVKECVKEIFLKPFYPVPNKKMRYYQQLAINAAVKAILEGKERTLLTLATGTGKTTVAFQIIYKLWNNRWNLKGEYRRPKILYLADRSVLITDPHAKDFAIFGDARCLVPEEGLSSAREIYFSTYQSLAEDSNRAGAFRDLPRDFFDLIVVDECHRGSASDDSNWRIILDYFNPAVKLGLTATPLRSDNVDTYRYFGNPLYEYTLKQGIEDGFLAPYIVHRVITDIDAAGFEPQQGQVDDYGRPIPEGTYTTADFERTLSVLPRTKTVAKHLFDFMQKNGKADKTIVFCVDQEHADQFRREISNLNRDLVQQYPDYVVRIVSEEGDTGKGYLSRFMDIDETFPVIVTTSKLLSTGVDIPTCKNIVIFRTVNSMTEFKQIIGRGTRVREDKEKLFFTILDYTGSATRQFADPDFDGMPPLITEEEIDDNGNVLDINEWKPENSEDEQEIEQSSLENENENIELSEQEPVRRKLYLSHGVEVRIAVETVQMRDANGKLRTVQFNQYAKEQITTLFTSINEFHAKWNDLSERKNIIAELESRGISAEQLMDISKQKECDLFDLICFAAYDLKPLTRKQRADLLLKNKPDFFANYSEKAREVLSLIIKKYVDYGLNQIRPNIVLAPPISQIGNARDIANEFGGIDKFIKAIEDLQILLYAEVA